VYKRQLDSYTVFDWISGHYDRGTLTLSGFASRPALVEQAMRTARATAGVDEVVNDIELLPSLQGDDMIRLRAYVAIYGHSGLSRYAPGGGLSGFDVDEINRAAARGLESTLQFRGSHPIHIVVSGGSVQLLGRVATSGDRQLAEFQVRTLPGILNVVNRLEVAAR
jgi:osmotically-inducible protein OsmY